MRVEGKVVVVTGGAAGIGKALCERFHAEGAARVVVADLAVEAARSVAERISGDAIGCDVADEGEMARLVERVEDRHGPIGLFCSNAGIAVLDARRGEAASSPDHLWTRAWQVNVMAHVHAARVLAPRMAGRGGGYFLNTVSAAGLLSRIDGAVYSTTKHAAIGFAESLAITHRDQGIGVSVLCPQGVDTPMLRAMPGGGEGQDGIMSAAQVADCVVKGLADERFLILPHPAVAEYMRRKTHDYDRWIAGMARLRNRLNAR